MIFLHNAFAQEFGTYLELGFTHILDLQGYDHILFIVALCALYRWEEWRNVLVLVTAFTIGHSLTLALAALDLIRVPQSWIDLLIPLTILMTAANNIRRGEVPDRGPLFDRRQVFNYGAALVFGLIHGMGFSNYFRFLLGAESSIVNQLLAFNLGLEAGQLIVVGLFMLMLVLFTRVLRTPHKEWNLVVSGGAAGIALTIILELMVAA
ncbi:MAG: HupE/UreJ family protein [Phaeodactylibacter sp.]|uniref:HupE/UreJ family protein n=1 Tax=Phaeodactylibacter sp. TaxID=1940289 RepID=UPI0032EE9995